MENQVTESLSEVDDRGVGDASQLSQYTTLEELEQQHKELLKAKQDQEREFEQQRAKMKELFLQREDDLRREREKSELVETEKLNFQVEMKRLKDELDEAKSQITIAECTMENEIETERRKCQEEIASLQRIMREEAGEMMHKSVKKYEKEIVRLKKVNDFLEQEMKNQSADKEGMLSVVTKTLAKKVVSLNAYSQSFENIHDNNLEDSMKKAQEDAEMLRSVVVPLEEEIKALKEKLRAADDQLRMYEAAQRSIIKGSDAVVELLKGKSTSEIVSELDDKLKELNEDLKAEKSSRSDLEMYVAVLNTQKSVLQEDNERLRNEMTEVNLLLEREKREHSDLKITWQAANDQLLEVQWLQAADLKRIHSVLTPDQQKLIEENQKKDEERREHEKRLKQLQQDSDMSKVPEIAEKRLASPILSRLSPLRRKSPSPNRPATPTMDPSHSAELTESEHKVTDSHQDSSLDLGRSGLASFLFKTVEALTRDGPLVHSASGISLNTEDTRGIQDSGVHDCDSTPGTAGEGDGGEKSNINAISTSQAESMIKSLSEVPPEQGSGSGRSPCERLVSEKEWESLNEEVKRAREKLSRPCDMCANYEHQLQRVQEQNKEQVRALHASKQQLERMRSSLQRIEEQRREDELKIEQMSKDAEKKVAELTEAVASAEGILSAVSEDHRHLAVSTREHVRQMAAQLERATSQASKLQAENDALIGRHSVHSQALQNEVINLPDTVEELQELMLKMHEDLITAKVVKEHLEDRQRSELHFLKDQALGEQQAKDNLEESLTQEIDSLRERLGTLESVATQLEEEHSQRVEIQLVANQYKTELDNLQSTLDKQIHQLTDDKVRLESEVAEYRSKLQRLQDALETSELVQRDFVKFNQSLQMEIEKIRQSGHEVRWQHEEDADDCNSCRLAFGLSRRKHHCRHCGRIFCNECTSKTVNSGPNNRPSRVCDVCRTLLCSNEAPYFSSEPPNPHD